MHSFTEDCIILRLAAGPPETFQRAKVKEFVASVLALLCFWAKIRAANKCRIFFSAQKCSFPCFCYLKHKDLEQSTPSLAWSWQVFGNSIYEHVWEQQEQKQEQKHRKSRSKVTIFMVWGGGGFLTMWGGWVFLLRYPLYYTIRNTQYITHNTLPYTYLLNLHRYLQQVLNPYGYLTYELNSFVRFVRQILSLTFCSKRKSIVG